MTIRTTLLLALALGLTTPAAATPLPSSVQLDPGPMSAGWLMTVEGGLASDEVVAERYYTIISDPGVSQLDALVMIWDGACLGCFP